MCSLQWSSGEDEPCLWVRKAIILKVLGTINLILFPLLSFSPENLKKKTQKNKNNNKLFNLATWEISSFDSCCFSNGFLVFLTSVSGHKTVPHFLKVLTLDYCERTIRTEELDPCGFYDFVTQNGILSTAGLRSACEKCGISGATQIYWTTVCILVNFLGDWFMGPLRSSWRSAASGGMPRQWQPLCGPLLSAA